MTLSIRPEDRRLDWESRHDERSRNFPVAAAMPTQLPEHQFWRRGPVIDQGAEGACVGYGWTNELLAEPKGKRSADPLRAEAYAKDWYKAAQQIDEWEGDTYSGTSVLAGAKVGVGRKHYESYRWAFSIDEVRDAVLGLGPVVIGIPWYEAMYRTRRSGLVEVGGRKVGGHCILLTGYHPQLRILGEGLTAKHDVFEWFNSWGRSYGRAGRGLIEKATLASLLAEEGEACVPLNRLPVRVPL